MTEVVPDPALRWTRWKILRAEPLVVMSDHALLANLKHAWRGVPGVHFAILRADGTPRDPGPPWHHKPGDLLRITDDTRAIVYRLVDGPRDRTERDLLCDPEDTHYYVWDLAWPD